MKRLILFFSFFLFSYALFPQTTIPNSGFESWEDNKNATDWNSSFSTVVFQFITVNYAAATKSTDSHSGDFAMQLKRQTVNIPGQDPIYLPGICQLGDFNIDTIVNMVLNGEIDMDITRMMSGGTPFTEIPFTVKAWIKYEPENGADDELMVGVLLTKTNEMLGTLIVAQGNYTYGETIGEYTEITIPIEVLIPDENPEKINIIFSTASGYGCGDAVLYVDDVSVESPSGITAFGSIPCTIFPNPAYDVINISVDNSERFEVTLLDMTGKKILSQNGNSQSATLKVNHLSSGTYLLQLNQGDKKTLHKVVIE